jgi:hypothetical protein
VPAGERHRAERERERRLGDDQGLGLAAGRSRSPGSLAFEQASGVLEVQRVTDVVQAIGDDSPCDAERGEP